MKHVPLGNTGMLVSAYSLGCLNFGSRTNKKTSFQLLDHFFEAGGNFLDTANNYAIWNDGCVGGESESLLGEWMKERKNRHQIILATKVGAKPVVPKSEKLEGLSRQAIENEIDESLLRLGTDYVDLYYAHVDDIETELEETLETFDSLIKAGKVRAIGCSNYRLSRILEAKAISMSKGWESYCCIQQRYTYLQPRVDANFGLQVSVDEDLLAYCSQHDDFTLMAYSPLLGGIYNRKDAVLPDAYRREDQMTRMDTLRKVAGELGATPNQLILAWMLQNHPRALPIVAASDLTQLEENLGALKLRINSDQLDQLNGACLT
ncbi:aldo/keto reductase [Paenibacillus sp. BR1-192]|uniref:aldo/keto reductase n=1 Tax=Paenibacillus sp. BR1-192 TaxID=3032287 RepID=UPI00240E5411|nr:aldo/keto reductase [Paenibacillus sp. BR1-192]WFB61606.1 aldo/keto reductase [Paenibacillus sp. BR1-192]